MVCKAKVPDSRGKEDEDDGGKRKKAKQCSVCMCIQCGASDAVMLRGQAD